MAWALEQQQLDYMLADPGTGGHASVVAAGLMNPVTGRRYTLQPLINECWEAADSCYGWWSEVTGQTLIRATTIHRFHRSASAQNQWEANGMHESGNWAGNLPDEYMDQSSYHASYGGVVVNNARIVATGKLYTEAIRYLRHHDKLIEDNISFDEWANGSPFRLNDKTFDIVIDTTGIGAADNSLWQHIPFRYNKGEALIIKAPDLPENNPITRNIIIVPQGSAHFWVGSHNHWDDHHPGPTAIGLDKLTADINATIRVPFEIIRHRAAIRPVIQDRKPVVGPHHTIKNMFILNGMGTKGYTLAPYHAHQLAALIAHGTPLSAATHVGRFY